MSTSDKEKVNLVSFMDDTEKTSLETIIRNKIKSEEDAKHPTDPEKKKYLILFKLNDLDQNKGFDNFFEIVTGRTATRQLLMNYIETIDIEETLVVVETVLFTEAATGYNFLKYCEKFFDDGFDVDDHIASPEAIDDTDEEYI